MPFAVAEWTSGRSTRRPIAISGTNPRPAGFTTPPTSSRPSSWSAPRWPPARSRRLGAPSANLEVAAHYLGTPAADLGFGGAGERSSWLLQGEWDRVAMSSEAGWIRYLLIMRIRQ